jgi:carbon storage regulator
MLVLTRKVGERIVIANGIVVQVIEVVGRQVRIGIQAPSGVKILRDELLVDGKPRHRPEGAARKQAALPCNAHC